MELVIVQKIRLDEEVEMTSSLRCKV
jgi:hypothetical protein